LFSQPIFLQSNQGLGTEVGKSGKWAHHAGKLSDFGSSTDLWLSILH
jgi:hypothetical protein